MEHYTEGIASHRVSKEDFIAAISPLLNLSSCPLHYYVLCIAVIKLEDHLRATIFIHPVEDLIVEVVLLFDPESEESILEAAELCLSKQYVCLDLLCLLFSCFVISFDHCQ